MSGWIKWDELKEKWDLADHELIDCLKQGLQPYSQNTGNLYECPQEFHFGHHAKMRISELNDQIEKWTNALINSGTDPYLIYSDTEVSKLRDERSIHKRQLDKFINEDPYFRSWKHFTFGRDEEKAKELISELKNQVHFKLKDIEDLEKKHSHLDLKKRLNGIETHGLHKNVFPCETGTKWSDISITLVANDMVRIKTPRGEGKYTYHKLEMSDKKSGDKPKIIWYILQLFAKFNGRLDSNIPESAKRILLNDFNIDYYRKLPDYTKRLNKHLKEIFKINDSIFKYHYNKHKAYITKIEFKDRRHTGKSDLTNEMVLYDEDERPLHDTEVEDIQDKLSISNDKRFDG